MCLVSVISGEFYSKFTSVEDFPPIDYKYYLELIEKAREYDEQTGKKDCQDPVSEEWETKLRKFMKDNYGLDSHTIQTVSKSEGSKLPKTLTFGWASVNTITGETSSGNY